MTRVGSEKRACLRAALSVPQKIKQYKTRLRLHSRNHSLCYTPVPSKIETYVSRRSISHIDRIDSRMRDSILELQLDNWDKYSPKPAWRVCLAVRARCPRSDTSSRGDLCTQSLNHTTHTSLSSTKASL